MIYDVKLFFEYAPDEFVSQSIKLSFVPNDVIQIDLVDKPKALDTFQPYAIAWNLEKERFEVFVTCNAYGIRAEEILPGLLETGWKVEQQWQRRIVIR